MPEQAQAQTPASVTIIDASAIERLGEPLVPDLLRLVPSAVGLGRGPAGSLTEVRIRGAEANHTLLFIDGIRANDPAAGMSRVRPAQRRHRIAHRGRPRAAVGAVGLGSDRRRRRGQRRPATGAATRRALEAASFGFQRASAAAPASCDNDRVLRRRRRLAARDGIDSFDGHGDKDGYRNLSGADCAARVQLGPAVELGAAGFALIGRSEFDGFDPVTFLHADTLDNSRNRLAAARLWARLGSDSDRRGAAASRYRCSARPTATSSTTIAQPHQRHAVDGRRAGRAPVSRPAASPTVSIAAAEAERETFQARDATFGGFTDQDRSRDHTR